MKLYYINNFRSFNDTIIKLAQVNFLVGENSTGKTSLMSLINLINSPNFWLNYDFNTESINLGSFEDMISVNTTDENFLVGIFFQHSNKIRKNIPNYIFYLITFYDDDGLAAPCELTIFVGSYLLILKKNKSKILYKIKKTNITIDPKNEINDNIDKIKRIIRTKKETNKFKELDEEIEEKMPITFIPRYLFSRNPSIKKLLNELPPFPFFLNDISWFAPIRCKPKPFYLGMKSKISPEGDHTPYILKTILGTKSSKSEEDKNFENTINNFGKESGLFDSIDVVSLGDKKTSPFELDIIKNGASYKISSVGYGVSQIFPILIDILARSKGSWFSIQQPEVHLHPKAQAAFGELLFQLSLTDNKSFIIETHSDFIIDRFRYCLSKSKRKVDSKIFYFEKEKTLNVIRDIDIKNDGHYADNLPDNFRTFFVNESLKMLDI